MRAALACFAVASLVACSGQSGGAVKPKRPVGPAIDAAEARKGASDLVTEIYETLGRGNKDSLFTLLDDSLMVFGPRRADMLGTRADALVALGQVVDPKTKKQLAIESSKLEVITAPGGRSALAIDTASINGHPHTVMAVLTNSNDLWLVEAVAVAETPTEPQIKAELAKDAVVPPGAAGAKKIDPNARLAVEKFQRGLLDQAAWGTELSGRADAIVVGPMAGEITRGKKDIRAMWKKRVDGKTRAALSGEITAAVTDDGQLAWVSAPLTRVEGEGTQPLPLRAFAVYVNAGGDWKLFALHESVALGEPGSGAAFKKILPPKPVEEKPPEVIAASKPKEQDKGRDKGQAEAPKAKVAKKASRDEETAKPEPEKPKKIKQDKAKSEEDEAPKKKKLAKAAEEDDEAPKKKKKKRAFFRDDEGDASDEAPKKKAKAKAKGAEEEEEAPKKKKKKRAFFRDDEEDASDEAPKKKSKSKAKGAEEEEEAPKKSKSKSKAKAAESEAKAEEEEAPKKSKSKAKAAESEAKAEEEEAPKKAKSKAKAAKGDAESEAKAEEEAPKKSKAKAAKGDAESEAKAEEEAPKKSKSKSKAKAEEEAPKKKPAAADEDEIEVID
ncbi:MAG TPA: nuclear transport factor 2 family protein [Kofleriaceae bacterium]|nr:nuclear transport factor 2 family protein [Kofleriaceae bacterium]